MFTTSRGFTLTIFWTGFASCDVYDIARFHPYDLLNGICLIWCLRHREVSPLRSFERDLSHVMFTTSRGFTLKIFWTGFVSCDVYDIARFHPYDVLNGICLMWCLPHREVSALRSFERDLSPVMFTTSRGFTLTMFWTGFASCDVYDIARFHPYDVLNGICLMWCLPHREVSPLRYFERDLSHVVFTTSRGFTLTMFWTGFVSCGVYDIARFHPYDLLNGICLMWCLRHREVSLLRSFNCIL